MEIPSSISKIAPLVKILQSMLASTLGPWIRYQSRKSFPQIGGNIYLKGLENPVQLNRDQHGITRIRAKGRNDLFFGQGFAHAQDRLFQMEMHRRISLGRLAEMFGPAALDTDRLVRTLGFQYIAEKTWERTSPKVREYYEAYSEGVNALLQSGQKLPVEFSLLKHTPEPWTPIDTVAFICFQGWSLSHGWSAALTRSRLMEKLSRKEMEELDFHYSEEHPSTLPHWNGPIRDVDKLLYPHQREGSGRGSNAWVISAKRSSTGHAILANDMHLPLKTPSIWYGMELQSDDGFHISGSTIAGTPCVWVGQNSHIGWGATLAFIDSEDLFLEQLDPKDETRYRFKEEWRQAEVRTEKIQVKGGPDHEEKVVVTHHGPLLHKFLPTTGSAISLCSITLRPYDTLDSLVALNEAKDWNEFRSAVSRLGATQLNLAYADKDDNIGYWMTGRIPIRAKGDGTVPIPGWTGEYDWTGEVPKEENPHTLNPPEGYIITCNNRVVDDSYPHFLGDVYMNGYRAKRLEELITSKEKVSPEDCRRFQFDVFSLPGTKMVSLLEKIHPKDPDAKKAIDLLRKWDGQLDIESIGGAVYQFFFASLSRAILIPKLGEELFYELMGRGPHPVVYSTTEFFGQWVGSLLRMLENPKTVWISDRDKLIVEALGEAVAGLRNTFGPQEKNWKWGQLHRASFPHTLSKKTVLDQIFSPKPVPVGGDTDTVYQTASLPDDSHENNNYSPSWRQVLDLQNPKNSGAMVAPGQSGQIGNAYYDDLILRWHVGEYFPLREADPVHSVSLSPQEP